MRRRACRRTRGVDSSSPWRRPAIVNARFDAARAAAAEVLRGAAADSQDEARARLYFDAGRLFSDGYDAARADLRGIAAAKLDRSDAGLLASVRSVAAQLRIAPSAGADRGAGRSCGRRQEGRRGSDDPTGRGGAEAHRRHRQRGRRGGTMSAVAPAAHAPHPAPLGPGGHAAPAPAHPRAAFAAVLDSLPNADARPNGAPSDEAGRPARSAAGARHDPLAAIAERVACFPSAQRS